jgi:hypothetical protein
MRQPSPHDHNGHAGSARAGTVARLTVLLALALLLAAACTGQEQPDETTGEQSPGEETSGDKTPGSDDGGTEASTTLTTTTAPDVEPPDDAPFRQSPWWPYLSSHIDDDDPRDVVGGPIEITASQTQGAVNWVMPGKRELDPTIFGTADDPKGAEKPAMLLGVPPPARESADGSQRTKQPTPFSDKAKAVEGSLDMTVVDATATDAGVSKDQIDFEATFTAPDGAEYRVVIERPAPHGWFLPTGGGVVTNFIQHGVTGWGTRLMPTEYDDVAVYGPATIFRDGEKIAEDRPAHMMLTEFVRGESYELATDANVDPGARHLHLMIFPFDQFGRHDAVPTGFELPNGKQQPFLHIMYPGVSAEGSMPTFDGQLPDGIQQAGQVPALDPPPEDEPYRQSPWWPYLSAHVDDDDPRDVLGGPLAVQGEQEQGSVNWVLPGKRELDPTIFGTADDPKGTEKPAMLVGAPVPAREPAPDGGQRTKPATPFSDKAEQVQGSVDMTLIDATATDAATTDDRIDFEATFTAPDGAEYRVVIDKAASHGTFIPTGGGVITNFIQHGVTGWGTRLMPTEYDDAALYGAATIFRDGERIAKGRPAHVMVTEFVRGESYELVTDDNVEPGARHLHLMIFPFDRLGNHDAVPTGFELPNGEQQPFLHIMYPGFEWTATGALP